MTTNIRALIITSYTILGVPSSSYSIIYHKTLFYPHSTYFSLAFPLRCCSEALAAADHCAPPGRSPLAARMATVPPEKLRAGLQGFGFNIGALMITYTIWGVAYYIYSIMGPEILF